MSAFRTLPVSAFSSFTRCFCPSKTVPSLFQNPLSFLLSELLSKSTARPEAFSLPGVEESAWNTDDALLRTIVEETLQLVIQANKKEEQALMMPPQEPRGCGRRVRTKDSSAPVTWRRKYVIEEKMRAVGPSKFACNASADKMMKSRRCSESPCSNVSCPASHRMRICIFADQ